MIQWRVLNFSGFCPSGQQLRGSGPLAGCVICRDGQHQPPRGAALWLHWCGYAHRHTTRCQTLLPVSHSLKICCLLIHLLSPDMLTVFSLNTTIFLWALRWATTTAASSSSASTDPRTYDEVYESVTVRNPSWIQLKLGTFLSSQSLSCDSQHFYFSL